MTRPAASYRFPAHFVWGNATSAVQIEGAARLHGKGESIWDRFARQPDAVAGGDTPHVARDHYHRYRSDFALLGRLGLRLASIWNAEGFAAFKKWAQE